MGMEVVQMNMLSTGALPSRHHVVGVHAQHKELATVFLICLVSFLFVMITLVYVVLRDVCVVRSMALFACGVVAMLFVCSL